MLYKLPAFPWLRQEGQSWDTKQDKVLKILVLEGWAEWLRVCTALTDDISSGLSIEYSVTAYNPTSRESL